VLQEQACAIKRRAVPDCVSTSSTSRSKAVAMLTPLVARIGSWKLTGKRYSRLIASLLFADAVPLQFDVDASRAEGLNEGL
jgi:hypothetical protein